MAFNAGEIEAKITADRKKFTKEIKEATKQGKAWEKKEFKAKLGFDLDYKGELKSAEAAGKKWSSRDFRADLGFNLQETREVANAQRLGQQWDSREFDADLTANDKDVNAKFAQAMGLGMRWDSREFEAKFKIQLDEANDKIARLEGKLKQTKRTTAESVGEFKALGTILKAITLPAGIALITPTLVSATQQATNAAGAIGALMPAALLSTAVAASTAAIGLKGFKDALTEEDAKKKAAAFAGLAPAAKEAVTAIQSLGKAYGEMRKITQQRLFLGLADDIQRIGNTYLPTLTAGYYQNAAALNGLAQRIIDFGTKAKTVEDVSTIFTNTARTVNALAPGLTSILSIFTQLGAVGSTYLPQLANTLSNALGRADAFITKMRETGQLDQYIQSGIDALNKLIGITGNAISIFSGLFNAVRGAGVDALGSIERLTGSMANFVNSAQGTQQLTAIFKGLSGTVSELTPGVDSLFRNLVGGLSEALPMLPQLGDSISNAAEKFAPLLQVAGELAGAVLPHLASGIDVVAGALGPVAAIVGGIVRVFTSLPGPLQAVALALIPLKMAGGWIGGFSKAIQGTGIAAQASAAQHSKLAASVVGIRTQLAPMGGLLGTVRTGLTTLGTAYSAGAAKGREFAANGVTAVANATRMLPGPLGGAGQAATGLGSAFQRAGGVVGGSAGVMKAAVSGLGSGMKSALSGIVGFLGGPWGAAFAAAGVAIALFMGKQAEAKQKAAEYRSELDNLKGTLDGVTGAITAGTNAYTADKLAKDGSIQKARELGISQQDLVAAYNGVPDAVNRVNTALQQNIKGTQEYKDAVNYLLPALTQYGVTADDLAAAATGNAAAEAKVSDAIQKSGVSATDSGSSIADYYLKMRDAAGASRELGQAMGLSNQQIAQAQKELIDAKVAADAFGQSIRDGQQNLNSYGNAAVQMNGQLNTNALGADRLKTSLDATSKAAQQNATSMGLAAQKAQGVGAGAQAAATSMQQSRAAFLQSAAAAGITGQRAEALANQMGLIPALVTTHFNQDSRQAADAMDVLRGKIVSVPDEKHIRINDNSPETRAKLEALGFTVTAIPNSKDVMVTTDTGPAASALADLTARIKALPPGTIKINADGKAANDETTGLINRANSAVAMMKIQGDPGPGDNSLAALKNRVDTAVAKMSINGTPDPALVELKRVVDTVIATKPPPIPIKADGSPVPPVLDHIKGQAAGTDLKPPIKPNPAPVPPALTDAQRQALGAPLQPPVKPDPAPVAPALTGYQDKAAGTTGTAVLGADGIPANNTLGGFLQGANGSTATAHLNAESAGADGRVFAWAAGANGTVALAHLNAESAGADGRVIAWQGGANGTVATAHLNAESAGADGRVQGWVAGVSGTTATAHVNAESAQADARVVAWKAGADGTWAMSHLNAESQRADDRVRGWKAGADGTWAMSHVDAETSRADAAVKAFRDRASQPITVQINTVGGPPRGAGGMVIPGNGVQKFAGGGLATMGGYIPGYKPGVDDVPAVLSKGEAVLVPELVKKIGPQRILAANAAASGRESANGAGAFAGGGMADLVQDIGDPKSLRPTRSVTQAQTPNDLVEAIEKLARQINTQRPLVGSIPITPREGVNTTDLAEKVIFKLRHATRGVYRR